METNVIILCGVIFIAAFVQSLFGVGLLLFGTPLLLFAGYSFGEALYVLLPCSLTIITLQIIEGGRQGKSVLLTSACLLWMPVVAGTALVLIFGQQINFLRLSVRCSW